MEKDAKYFIVGVFVSICLVALIGFFIWMAGAHKERSYTNYTLYFTDAISGLKVGSAVQYKGVEVGNVTDIRLSPEREDLVKVDISIDDKTPVRSKTSASLGMQGVTGMVFILMKTDIDDTEPAPRIAGERYPVLQGSGTQLAKLLENIPDITKQVLEISEKLNRILDEGNVEALNKTLANLENMSRDLNGLLSEENVQNTSVALANVAETSENLNTLIARFEHTADEIDKTVKTISQVVSTNGDNVTRFTREGLDQILSMSRETQKMTESIRKAADKLEQDPSQILYQPSYRGVEIEK